MDGMLHCYAMYLDKLGTGGLNKNFSDDFNLGPVFGKKELR